MNRFARVADKVAKMFVAGVSIGVKGYDPKDVYWVEMQLGQALFGFDRKQINIDTDGNTSPSDYTGTINIYVQDPEIVNAVVHKAWDVVTHLQLVGIRGKVRQDVSRMTKGPVVRVDVESNKDSEFVDLMDTHITYSTWRSVLDWMGFTSKNEEAGSMPIQEYLSAYQKPADFAGKQKEAMFARQIAEMAKAALRRGYREISWS